MAYDDEGNLVPDPIPASVVLGEAVIPNHPVLAQLKEQIETLTGQRDSWITDHNIMRDRWVNAKAAIEALKSNVKQLIVDNIDSLDKDFAEALAEAMDIELTKTVAISGTINFSGTVEVSIFDEEALDDVRYNTNVSDLSVEFNGDYLDGLEYDTEDVEWTDY
jgi:myo-inositol catabolism protein IolC